MSYNFTHRHYKKPFQRKINNFLTVSKYKTKFDLWSLQSKIIIEKYKTFTFLLLDFTLFTPKGLYFNENTFQLRQIKSKEKGNISKSDKYIREIFFLKLLIVKTLNQSQFSCRIMNYLYIHINHNFVVRVPIIISILVEYHLSLQRLIKFIDN